MKENIFEEILTPSDGWQKLHSLPLIHSELCFLYLNNEPDKPKKCEHVKVRNSDMNKVQETCVMHIPS